MPSFAELKAKASTVTSSGVERLQHVRDRNTSVPMKKTNWDPYSGTPAPPPPPPRSLINKSTKPALAPLPPPPSRTSSGASAASASRVGSISPAMSLPSRGPSSSAPPPPPRSRGTAPPPPPARINSSIAKSVVSPNIGPGPPPIVRSTRPGVSTTPLANEPNEIDWANLSREDKEVFFSWLDEFFANFKFSNGGENKELDHELIPSQAQVPPPIRATTKPISVVRTVGAGNQSNSFVLSYPPATKYGSAALDLAHFFAPGTVWTEAWYDNSSGGSAIPPSLVNSASNMRTSGWMTLGTKKTTTFGFFFSDLSFFWGTVEFSTINPTDQNHVRRNAAYLPPPKALGRNELVEAHETYGDTIALYAESFLGTGQVCARGECWDLANEGLKYFADYDYIPKPVPSISRTHGHLIYEGRASNGGREMVGRWRGGDDRIRRGDIAEWRLVRIGVKGAPRGSFFTLGNPDHTAVIVSDAVPSVTPRDGGSLLPSDLGIITVIEQSQGQLPEKRDYDLSCFEEGEMWIYRPISMQVYIGVSTITPTVPDGVQGLQRL